MAERGPLSAFHGDNGGPDVDRQVAALDAQAATAGVQRLREWAHGELDWALVGQLVAAGLEIDDVGSQALIEDHRTVPWSLVRMLGETAVRRELITTGSATAASPTSPMPRGAARSTCPSPCSAPSRTSPIRCRRPSS